MKILEDKFITNHRNNNCVLLTIFYMTTKTLKPTAAIVTAAIMIFMQAIVFVNTTKTGRYIHTDTNTNLTTTTAIAARHDLSKNPIITQQSPKVLTKTQKAPIQPTALKAFAPLNAYHVSGATLTTTITKTKTTKPQTRSSGTLALVETQDVCKSLADAWGDVDPNIFYICNEQTKKPLQLHCPDGKGFFLGLGYSGCISYEQWPACISSGHLEQVVVCDNEHMQQPWQSKNPNKFYLCLKETIEPTIVNCEPGKGFVHAIITTSVASSGSGSRNVDGVGIGMSASASAFHEIVGCTNWKKWRNYMDCNDYY